MFLDVNFKSSWDFGGGQTPTTSKVGGVSPTLDFLRYVGPPGMSDGGLKNGLAVCKPDETFDGGLIDSLSYAWGVKASVRFNC